MFIDILNMIVLASTITICSMLIIGSILFKTAIDTVPTENSFKPWITDILNSMKFLNIRQHLDVDELSIIDRLARNIFGDGNMARRIAHYNVVNRIKATFLHMGFMRIAFCMEDHNRYIFMGVFNTWIPVSM